MAPDMLVASAVHPLTRKGIAVDSKGMRSAKETIQNLRGSEELAEGGKTNPEPLNVTTLKSLQTYSDAAP